MLIVHTCVKDEWMCGCVHAHVWKYLDGLGTMLIVRTCVKEELMCACTRVEVFGGVESPGLKVIMWKTSIICQSRLPAPWSVLEAFYYLMYTLHTHSILKTLKRTSYSTFIFNLNEHFNKLKLSYEGNME